MACTVNWLAKTAAGVPASVPFALRANPGGREPPMTENAYGGVPPEAVIGCEYATPTAPETSGE